MKQFFAALLVATTGLGSLPARADLFTESALAKPVLQAISGQWVTIRPYEGQDLLYFTMVLSYRCAIEQIRFSYNGGPLQVWEHEPCWHGEAQPYALKMDTHLPYAVAPLNSLQQITVDLLFDDGSTLTHSYDRAAIERQ